MSVLGPVYNASHGGSSDVFGLLIVEISGVMFVLAGSSSDIIAPPFFEGKVGRIAWRATFVVIGVGMLLHAWGRLSETESAAALGVIIPCLVLGAAVSVWFRNWLRLRGSCSWPSAQGQVLGGEVRDVAGRGHHYVAEISYSYEVNQNYFAGYHQQKFYLEQAARNYVNQFLGKTIPIRYSPSKPEISRLEKAP